MFHLVVFQTFKLGELGNIFNFPRFGCPLFCNRQERHCSTQTINRLTLTLNLFEDIHEFLKKDFLLVKGREQLDCDHEAIQFVKFELIEEV